MSKNGRLPELIFEVSWEVCNKVGGIYTVLSTRAKTLCAALGEEKRNQLVFIGPDVWKESESPYFKEDADLLPDWRKIASEHGMSVRIGRWLVPGEPVAVLIGFQEYFAHKNEIYERAWRLFGVDSLHGYADYDEASMFSYAAGRFAGIICGECYTAKNRIIYQAHEWMSGLGMLFLKNRFPWVSTIFTTHATSIGRSITSNNKNLYAYFSGYDGDQMARELNMEAKHSVEKQSAHYCDCFTTVSSFTDKECEQLLQKKADVVLPNGFEANFVPQKAAYTAKRKAARKALFGVASALMNTEFDDSTLVVSTSGRNDFRCKGFDLYMDALARLKQEVGTDAGVLGKYKNVLALIEVPCWTKEPRQDLLARCAGKEAFGTRLPNPFITHDLHNFQDDRIVNMLQRLGLTNEDENPVKVLLIPSYLEGNDGIFDIPYYDLLTANDMCLYPSYYEPWGYTPLESCAFSIPTLTTDLSGFGQWINEELGHTGTLEDGVVVLSRNDDNYSAVVEDICNVIIDFLHLPKTRLSKIRKNAQTLANKAEWSNFIEHYYAAYDFALSKNK